MESNCLPLPQVKSQNQRIQPQTIPVQGAEMIKGCALGAFPVVGALDVPYALLGSQFNDLGSGRPRARRDCRDCK